MLGSGIFSAAPRPSPSCARSRRELLDGWLTTEGTEEGELVGRVAGHSGRGALLRLDGIEHADGPLRGERRGVEGEFFVVPRGGRVVVPLHELAVVRVTATGPGALRTCVTESTTGHALRNWIESHKCAFAFFGDVSELGIAHNQGWRYEPVLLGAGSESELRRPIRT